MKGGRTSKQQPKQRRDEDSSFERSIKANIQEMQDGVRMTGEQLERAHRGLLSRRLADHLDRSLERCREVAQETEQLFRDWTVQMAGEPTERHRKRFSYEKLQKAFEEEMAHLRDIARRVSQTQQDAPGCASGPTECEAVCGEEESSSYAGEEEDETQLLLEDSGLGLQASATIQNRISREREEGIRRIQSQVAEVKHVFHDLASLVTDQGQRFETIETQAESSASSTKMAVQELKRAADRQRSARERLCCMLVALILLLCLVLWPHTRSAA